MFTRTGNIRYWNDSRVLKDNNAATQAVLRKISNTNPIHIVVRQDSSGTTDIASQGFASFSPAQPTATFAGSTFDSSFATSVGGGEKPNWCGSKTDEIQTITIAGCDSSFPASSKQVNLTIVDVNYNVRTISFLCDANANSFRSSFMLVNSGKSVYVSVNQGSSPSTNVITIGYQGSVGGPKNWYQPYIASAASGLTVTVKTLQEGGYVNNQFQAITVLPEIKSLWISKSAKFNVTLWYGSTAVNFTAINGNLTRRTSNFPIEWSTFSRVNHTKWVEYQITFAASSTFVAKATHVQVTTSGFSDHFLAFINTLTTSNNYPIFYKQPAGFSNSGQYTCYKREHNYTAWTYSTGNGNDGVAAEVHILIA